MMCFFNVYMSVIDYLDSSINYCSLTLYINQLFGVDKIFFFFLEFESYQSLLLNLKKEIDIKRYECHFLKLPNKYKTYCACDIQCTLLLMPKHLIFIFFHSHNYRYVF